MLIINRYLVSTPAPVLATVDNNPVTSTQSERWGGVNPVIATGAQGTAGNGNGLTFVDTPAIYQDQCVSALVQIKFAGTLTAAQPNYIKFPLSNLGLGQNRSVRAINVMGVYDPNSTEVGNNPTASVMMTTEETAIVFSIIKDSIIIKIPDGSQALYQGKILNVLIIHSPVL
jgi:hypothetical protein